MRNLRPIDINSYPPSDIFDNIGQNMKDGHVHHNRSNYNTHRDAVIQRYGEYTALCSPCRLEHLSAPLSFTVEERDTFKSMYDNNAAIRASIWQNLERVNGNAKIVCPLCGAALADELDHYVPRESYPEYSIHIQNLIPLCHDCNHKKGVKWLDGANQRRLFFNAYFDQLSMQRLFHVNVSIRNDFPYVNVDLVSNSEITSLEMWREASTCYELDLPMRYSENANYKIRTETSKIFTDYQCLRYYFGSVQDFWDTKRNIYLNYIQNYVNYFMDDIATYCAIASNEYSTWIMSKLRLF